MKRLIYATFICLVMISCSGESGQDAKSEDEIKKEIMAAIWGFADSWTVDDDIEALRGYFHEDIVSINPSERERVEGIEKNLAGYRIFMERTEFHKVEFHDELVQIYGDGNFAVVTLYYDLEFDFDGERIQSGGRDMLVMAKESGTWKIIADQFSGFPGE